MTPVKYDKTAPLWFKQKKMLINLIKFCIVMLPFDIISHAEPTEKVSIYSVHTEKAPVAHSRATIVTLFPCSLVIECNLFEIFSV